MKTNDLPQYMPYSQGDVSQPTLQQPPPPPQPPPPAGTPPSPWDPWDSNLPSADPSEQQDTRTLGSNAARTSSSSVLSVTCTSAPQHPKQQDDAGSMEKQGEYTVGNAPNTVTCQLHHMPEKAAASTFPVQTSSTAQDSQHEPQYSHAITIAPYNPDRVEKSRGYLKLFQGTVVTVLSGSREPSVLGNAFTCDYIFAWLANHEGKHDAQGWVPIDVLGNIPTCQDIAQPKNLSSGYNIPNSVAG